MQQAQAEQRAARWFQTFRIAMHGAMFVALIITVASGGNRQSLLVAVFFFEITCACGIAAFAIHLVLCPETRTQRRDGR